MNAAATISAAQVSEEDEKYWRKRRASDAERKRRARAAETPDQRATRQIKDAEGHARRRAELNSEEEAEYQANHRAKQVKYWQSVPKITVARLAFKKSSKNPPMGTADYMVDSIPDATPWLHICERPDCRQYTSWREGDGARACNAGHVQSRTGWCMGTFAFPVRLENASGAWFTAAILDNAVAASIPGVPQLSTATVQQLRIACQEFVPRPCRITAEHLVLPCYRPAAMAGTSSVHTTVITAATVLEELPSSGEELWEHRRGALESGTAAAPADGEGAKVYDLTPITGVKPCVSQHGHSCPALPVVLAELQPGGLRFAAAVVADELASQLPGYPMGVSLAELSSVELVEVMLNMPPSTRVRATTHTVGCETLITSLTVVK